MGRLGFWVLIALSLTLGAGAAQAEKRVALVVGNDRYQNLPTDRQLQRAVNDARAIGETLGKLGFEVIAGENLGRQALVDKLDEMTRRLTAGDVAFFFFAGHGLTVGGGNYLLPSDVPNVESGQETRLARTAIGENDIVSDLQQRGVRVAVVVLDACRDNPFRRPGVRTVGGERGLGRIEPARGVFTLYSAGLGQTALDRLGANDRDRNSVFTRVLLPKLSRPGLDLTALAIDVREEVARLAGSVGHDQRPAYYDETIGGRIYLGGLTGPDSSVTPQPLPPAINPGMGARAPAVTSPTVPKGDPKAKKKNEENLAQFSRHPGCYKYKSAGECEAMRRVMRAAIARGSHTAQDYAGPTYCGCGP